MNYDGECDLRQNRDCGQLWLDDRKLLWRTIRELKPQLAAETGTWMGGGSTFFIAAAMRRNAAEGTVGLLHTVDDNREMFLAALDSYATRWPSLKPYVHFHFGGSFEVYRSVLKAPLDFVLIDGGGDQVAIDEFKMLGPLVRPGGILMVHDWFNGKRVPALETHADWEILEIAGNGGGSFESGSVGFCKARKRR